MLKKRSTSITVNEHCKVKNEHATHINIHYETISLHSVSDLSPLTKSLEPNGLAIL